MVGLPSPPSSPYSLTCGRVLRSLGLTSPPPSSLPPKNPPTPIPRDRLIDLSPFLSPIDSSHNKQTPTLNPQYQSPLFRLPLELRHQIYGYVLPARKQIWVRAALGNGYVWERRPPSTSISNPGSHSQSSRHGPLQQTTPSYSSRIKQSDAHNGVEGACVEHFVCRGEKELRDFSWEDSTGAGCCNEVKNGFWDCMRQRGVGSDADALGLMRVCQRVYLELYDICSFCFDNPDTLNEFVDFYPVLPVQHVQIVLYASCLVYTDHEGGLISVPEYAGWALKLNVSWERKLKEVGEACKRIRGLTSLLISLHPEPVYQHFKNEERIIESLKMITAAPTIYVEVLGVQGKNREPVLLRSESKALVADTCRSGV